MSQQQHAPDVGDVAPDFRLRHTFGTDVSLAETLERGPALLVFYVFDFGGYQGTELSQLGQRAAEIRALGADLLAVAVTATFSQQAFAESLGVDFPLLSDWDRTACAAYGVQYDVWKGHRGLAKRSVFVVDRDRVVRYRWVTDDALVLPDLDEAVQALRSCMGAA